VKGRTEWAATRLAARWTVLGGLLWPVTSLAQEPATMNTQTPPPAAVVEVDASHPVWRAIHAQLGKLDEAERNRDIDAFRALPRRRVPRRRPDRSRHRELPQVPRAGSEQREREAGAGPA
jgi:hypothetical protein